MPFHELPDSELPSTEEMGWQLVAKRWRQKSKHIWVSPEGRYFVGVRDAWLEMKSLGAVGVQLSGFDLMR